MIRLGSDKNRVRLTNNLFQELIFCIVGPFLGLDKFLNSPFQIQVYKRSPPFHWSQKNQILLEITASSSTIHPWLTVCRELSAYIVSVLIEFEENLPFKVQAMPDSYCGGDGGGDFGQELQVLPRVVVPFSFPSTSLPRLIVEVVTCGRGGIVEQPSSHVLRC